MTTFVPKAAPGRWMSAAELSAASGLREDLVVRFIPSAGLSGQLYSAHHVQLAKFVKQLTDLGTPQAAVDTAVRDLRDRPYIDILRPSELKRGPRLWAVIGVTFLVALIIGGVIGGLIAPDRSTSTAISPQPAPVTVTKEAPPVQITPSIPASPDPVCAEWAPLADSYRGKRSDWVAIDPNIPASQWTPEQRATNMKVIPTLQAESQDLRRLAGEAHNNLLAALMRSQAVYEDAYALRLPNYQPEDQRLWQAVIDFGNAVNSVCNATRH